MIDEQTAAAWGAWLAAVYPKLADDEHNGKIIAEHLVAREWNEFNVRTAIYVNRNILHWKNDVEMETPQAAMARQQASKDQAKADADLAAKKASIAAAKRQREFDMLHPKPVNTRSTTVSEDPVRAKVEQMREEHNIMKEIHNASILQEIDRTIRSYININPATQRVSHTKTADIQKELRSIRVLNNGQLDAERTLAMVRAAIKRLP